MHDLAQAIAGRDPYNLHDLECKDMYPGLNPYWTDPAQLLRTPGEELDDLLIDR